MPAARPVLDRLMEKIEYVDTCWVFTGSLNNRGYGQIAWNGGLALAHRVAYTMFVGPIPDGLVLDHVKARGCLTQACCNPAHLEPVTGYVNTMRGRTTYANRTRCKSGRHDITDPANVMTRSNGKRQCKRCDYERRHPRAPGF